MNIRRTAVLAGAALLVAPLLWAGLAHAATATDLYVSPSGDDANPGTSAGAPVRTLPRARDLVRALDQTDSGEVRVNLATGTYRLAAPLTLGAADSGTNG